MDHVMAEKVTKRITAAKWGKFEQEIGGWLSHVQQISLTKINFGHVRLNITSFNKRSSEFLDYIK